MHGPERMKEEPQSTKLERERVAEKEEGISRERRGSPPAPSDKPEGDTPHPQDVNDISR